MSSEVIVVLIMVVLAVAFVIWVRINSHEHSPASPEQEPEVPKAVYQARTPRPEQAARRQRNKQR